jgi:hypothetical protein
LGKERKKYNEYDLNSREYGVGWTFKGEEFWFDKDDFLKLKDYCWYIGKDGYVFAHGYGSDNQRIQIRMHKLVMDANDDELVDHIKHKRYDNRKNELRKVTPSQNLMNYEIRKDNTSGYKGVCWNNYYEKWIAYIDKEKKHYSLGRFDDINDAAAARKEAEEQLFGEYSYDNSMGLNNKTQIESV